MTVEQTPYTLSLGDYLFKRLLSSGCKSVFGVPGDFNLPLLEHLYSPEIAASGLRYVGCCNELNAAYAADGYSRYTNKIGVLLTTYGVGELSAINGVAGASTEDVKLLHVVGVPTSKIYHNKSLHEQNLHHLVPPLHNANFVPPNHKMYHDMVKDKISCSTEYITDITKACDQIDRVIRDIYQYAKPGYIFIPSDFPKIEVDASNLIYSPQITLQDCIPDVSDENISQIVDLALKWIYDSDTPAAIGDVLVDRFGLNQEVNDFLELTQMWNFSTFMGKSVIDESNPNYMGLYTGALASPKVQDIFYRANLILHFGINANETSGYYSYNYNPTAKIIQFHPEYINFIDLADKSQNKIFPHTNFVHIMPSLLSNLDKSKLSFSYYTKPIPSFNPKDVIPQTNNENEITQAFLANKMPELFNPGDVFVCDTGAFQFNVRDFRFPENLKYITQGLFLSIGTALPSALGVGIAMQDYPRAHIIKTANSLVASDYTPRLVLCTGDGAAQMTIQELSTIAHMELPIEIFLWNNDGYTIERAILGPTRPYNDIAAWRWTKMLDAFGCDPAIVNSTMVDSTKKLEAKLNDLKNGHRTKKIEFLEVMLGVMDIPPQLKKMVSKPAPSVG